MNTNSNLTKLDVQNAARGSNRRFPAASGCMAGQTSSPANINTSDISSFLKPFVMIAEVFPKIIRPSINPTASCNIWGPLCQTGLIEAGISMANSTTATTVPCSYYLSAQARSAGTMFASMDYLQSFGHSPECASYADAKKNAFRGNPINLTYSNCSGNYFPYDGYAPPGVFNNQRRFGQMYDEFYCCGILDSGSPRNQAPLFCLYDLRVLNAVQGKFLNLNSIF